MIEVVSLSASGDVVDIAEAETPEAALLAARTLLDDYRDAFPNYRSAHPSHLLPRHPVGDWPEARFSVDGKVVRVGFAA